MKRSNFVMKLISVLLFIALTIYFCVYIYRYVTNPYDTETAVSHTVSESYIAQGIIVREETLFNTSEKYVTLSVRDGEKVGAGSHVATAFSTSQQQSLGEQINQLGLEIEQLNKLVQNEGLSEQDASQDSAIKQGIMEMNYSLARGEMDTLEENLVTLKTLILSATEEGTSATIARLSSEMEDLEKLLGSAGTEITSDSSGIFSSNVDGYEGLTPSDIESITATGLKSLISGEGVGDKGATGKLIQGIKWYFAAILPYEEAEKLSEMQDQGSTKVTANITGVSGSDMKMDIERVDLSESGDCVVVLSCNYAISDTLSSRITEAEIVYESYTGIKVSKEAVYRDEAGSAYVYAEKALQAQRHDITIIYEYGDYYIVEALKDDTDPLRQGAEIIVRARDLYDGKVIKS